MSPGKEAGATLLELVYGISLAAVLMGLGTPALIEFTKSNRMLAHYQLLATHIREARSTAVYEQRRIVMCPSSDKAVCLRAGEWHKGWIVFRDLNRNRYREPDEPILRVGPGVKGDLTLTTPVSRRRIRFMPSGFAPGSNTTFVFCDSRGAKNAKALVLSNTGRLRDAVKNSRGRPFQC